MAKAAKQQRQEDPTYEPIESVSAEEQAHCRSLLERIDRAGQARKDYDEKTLPRLRQIAYGIKSANEADASEAALSQAGMATVRTNLVFATMATLLPHIYARNPEIAVTPVESVGDGEYDKIKAFCETAQALLNRCFVEEGKLKKRMKANIRAAMTTSVGWLKMGWQEQYSGDPLLVRRINDIQDNLARIEATNSQLKASTDLEEQQRLRQELINQRDGVLQSEELKVFKGFVIDRCRTEDVRILDEDVVEFEDYENAGELAMGVYMSDSEYRARYGRKPWKGSKHFPPARISGLEHDMGPDGNREAQRGGTGKEAYRRVWEIWSMRDGRVYTICEGAHAYAREPYVPSAMPKRWHALYALGFNIVEGRWRPISDVELLLHLQEEYNHTRYLYAEARKEAIPVRVYRKGGELEEDEIDALAHRKARGWYGVSGNPATPVNNDIMQLDGITIDPAAYDVTLIRNDMDMMVGLSDASRASLIQAKTATEAQIMAQSLANRVAERQDAIEDMVSEMAEAALQIMLQKFTLIEVREIVGEGAEWPERADPEIWHQIRVKVRAGSSGKPNQAKEREDWAAIMPALKEGMGQVAELRVAGQPDMANAQIELLKETLRRFDERLDIDRFIPRQAGQGGEQDTAQLMQQLQEMQAQMAQLQEAYQQCQADLERAKMQEQAKLAEIENKRAADEAKAAADAEIQMRSMLIKAAVDLISRLGVVPGTHGVPGAMGELIDGASLVIQNVVDGKTALNAGGRPKPEPSAENRGQ